MRIMLVITLLMSTVPTLVLADSRSCSAEYFLLKAATRNLAVVEAALPTHNISVTRRNELKKAVLHEGKTPDESMPQSEDEYYDALLARSEAQHGLHNCTHGDS